MTNQFAVQFLLTVERIEGQQSPRIEVDNLRHLELPRPDGPHIKDVCTDWDLRRNINCDPKVEALENGDYDCLLAGSWEFEYSWDAEGVQDAELLIDPKYFEIQPALPRNLEGMMSPLEQALYELQDVSFIDNTLDEAREARDEVTRIIKQLGEDQ